MIITIFFNSTTFELIAQILILDAKCHTQHMLNTTCPLLMICVENQPESLDGVCQCQQGYIFNSKQINGSDYCIKNTTNNDVDQLNKNYKINQNFKSGNETIGGEISAQYEQKIKSSLQPHHIFAGVLIPILFVLIVIGTIFIYKKLHFTQHIRSIRRTHFSRPFMSRRYEDVMLGTNDNDDPPLI